MIAGARDTINIDESVHEIYKLLTDGGDPVNAPFKTMKDVFLWAACLGFQRGERKQILGKKLTIFRWAQFNQQIDVPIIKAIALSDSGKLEDLICQDKILDAIEEYANNGASELRKQLASGDTLNLWDLVETLNMK